MLKQSKVTQVSGATYDRIDDEGLHITVDGVAARHRVRHVVVCAGQDSVRGLYDALSHASAHLIGGADVAAELDAKRRSSRGPRSWRGCEG